MHDVRNAWKTVVALTAAAVLATSGCQARDRAGGQADVEVKELTFAITSDAPTQIKAWANEVDQLSKGTLKVTFVKDARAGQPTYEAGTIADVGAGKVDMAWVGARAFDQVGLTSFQPLLAPLLIDNLELQGKVFDAGIPQEMLSDLGKLDLVGVGVLPGPMRKVLGIRKPFTKPGDFAGAVVGIQDSGVAEQTFHALGATAKPVPASSQAGRPRRLRPAALLRSGNQYAADAKYVTGNLNLWPRPLVIIANRAAYDRLTADQHDIMAAAAKDAVPVAMEAERAADTDAVDVAVQGRPDLRPVLRRRPRGIREGARTGLHHDPEGHAPTRRGWIGSRPSKNPCTAPLTAPTAPTSPTDQAAGLPLRRNLPDEHRLAQGQGSGRALRRRSRRPARKGRSTTWCSRRASSGCGSGSAGQTPNASSAWRPRTSSSRTSWSFDGTDGSRPSWTSPTRTAS